MPPYLTCPASAVATLKRGTASAGSAGDPPLELSQVLCRCQAELVEKHPTVAVDLWGVRLAARAIQGEH